MRIMVKGGVWKNTEDEILKAAVMKYGLNQWARISSLLVRKSAKQCKSRWYEWLDPAIKKTEWSREEEEKLLHLAKIMPNQWRTIAPIVGRTASQCLQRYEQLLDQAQSKDNQNEEDDPRRLRPGEIDPNPETKPARPDPIDMDEDEKEMLSEARARLANTKGKKAKRKAREKQLEEARRLATLQKRRELRAAGIELPKAKRKIKGIDYNQEIPFMKTPTPGVFEVDWDKANPPKPDFMNVPLDVLEGKRKRDDDDQRREDAKKQRLKEKSNLPAVIAQLNKMNDPAQTTTRSKLFLPTPQLSDRELEDLSKVGANEQEIIAQLSEEGVSVTNALLPSYGGTPAPVTRNVRTPVVPRTPIGEEEFTTTPVTKVARTPSALATPARDGNATPGRGGGKTPARDIMGINEQKEYELHQDFQRTEQLSSLKQQLSKLPAPQNKYDIVLPELPAEETDEVAQSMDEDASDSLMRQIKLEEEKKQIKLRLRSQTLKRNLPRPMAINKGFSDFKSQNPDPLFQKAEELLRQEIINFISYEAVEYPIPQCKIQKPSSWDNLSFQELEEAKKLIESEAADMRAKSGYSEEEFAKIWKETSDEFVFSPTQKKFLRGNTVTKQDRTESMAQQLESMKLQMGKDSAKASKLEQKINIYNGGYEARANNLLQQIQDLYFKINQSSIELECFTQLQKLEKQGAQIRVDNLRQLVLQQEQRESDLQKKYFDLKTEKENLLAAIA